MMHVSVSVQSSGTSNWGTSSNRGTGSKQAASSNWGIGSKWGASSKREAVVVAIACVARSKYASL
jgi:hypothetical protein